MQKIIDIIDTFYKSDITALQTALENQFQQRFNFLVEHIPHIQEIKFSFHQIDEDYYVMTDFILVKDNGYIYQYTLDYEENITPEISHWEFFKSEVAVIHSFINYVSKSASLFCSIFGGGTLSFHRQEDSIKS